MKNNKAEYVILVNNEENYNNAIKQGFKDVMKFGIYSFSSADLERYSASKVLVFIMDSKYDDDDNFQKLVLKIKERNKTAVYYIGDDFFTNTFPEKEVIENSLIDKGLIHEVDLLSYCGNCHKPIGHNQEYCAYCGTKKGEGEFKPFYNPAYAIYGPPIISCYKCDECGYTWETSAFDANLYCPICGAKKAIKTKEANVFDL